MSTDDARGVETVAAETWRHKMARPAGDDATWCACLRWSKGREDLETDERAWNAHLAAALAPVIEGLLGAARAEALREAADDWAGGEWRDVNFNRAGRDEHPGMRQARWLRERAAQTATSTDSDDPRCRREDCKHRWWRSGGMPTHRRGADCPEPATSTEQREAAARAEGRREVREAVEAAFDPGELECGRLGMTCLDVGRAPDERCRACRLRAVLAGQGGEGK